MTQDIINLYNSGDIATYVYRRTLGNAVYVKKASDLAGELSSSTSYMVDGPVDMGETQIIVPPGGLSLGGLNGSKETSYLYSTADNYTMFVSPDGGTSGNLFMQNMAIPKVNGANSKVFDLTGDGNGAFEFQNVNFGGFAAGDGITEIGELTDYRQGFFSGCGFYFVDDGLTFSGDWSGLVVTDTNVINPSTAMTLFKEGTALEFSGSVRSNINFNSVNASSVLFDFQPSNFLNTGSFALDNVRTTATDAVPNTPASSVYARFINCEGIENTYRGALWDLTSETTTTVSVVETPYKLLGTTIYKDLQHFESDGNNRIKYIGSQPIDIRAEYTFSLSGTNGDQIKVYIYRLNSSDSIVEEVDESGFITMNASGRAENISGFGYTKLTQGESIEFHVENYSGARDVTLLLDSTAAVQER